MDVDEILYGLVFTKQENIAREYHVHYNEILEHIFPDSSRLFIKNNVSPVH